MGFPSRAGAMAVVAVVSSCMVVGSAAGSAPTDIAYQPPVDAGLVELFRPPTTPYGPGNRGVDYATDPGTEVRAAAPGAVTFAGAVGSSRHVVVLHADGLRTSYSFLASVAVRPGDRVVAGQLLGTTSAVALHFGARAGDAYLDPLLLFGAGPQVRVHLVGDGPGSEADERAGLLRMLRGVVGVVRIGAGAAEWAARTAGRVTAPSPAELRAWWHVAADVAGPMWLRLAAVPFQWWAARDDCTPAGVAPPRPTGRRRAVLVAGLGSSSRRASIDDLDLTALGYRREDVVRFSYRGGTTDEQSYESADTQVDIRLSGARLRRLWERLAAEEPGVPIDVFAHSQGGLVARVALGRRAPPEVAALITLGTPHHGADLATALGHVRATALGSVAAAVGGRLRPLGLDPRARSLAQLSETSTFIADLDGRLPRGVRVTSISIRGDLVVPVPRSKLDGATNVVVSGSGVRQHADLPGSPAARREVALALAGMAPTCEGLGEALADAAVGEVISHAEDVGGAVLTSIAG